MGGQGSDAFKTVVKNMNNRQLVSKNDLYDLGGGKNPKAQGKYLDKDHINLKPTNVAALYPYEADLNMMVRRNVDEYPEYIKTKTGDQTYTRHFEVDKSPLKKI